MAGAAEVLTFDQLAAEFGRQQHELLALDLRPALQRCKVAAVADVKENFAGSHAPDGTTWAPLAHPRPSSQGNDQPLRNTGLLMASVTAGSGQGHVESISDTEMVLGTNLDYAATHQYGATIRPKNAQALSIPLTKEAARAGGAKDFPGDLFFFKPKAGDKAFLAEVAQKGRGKKQRSELTFHYLLLQQVVIPARPFLGWSPKLQETCAAILADFLASKFGPPGQEVA